MSSVASNVTKDPKGMSIPVMIWRAYFTIMMNSPRKQIFVVIMNLWLLTKNEPRTYHKRANK